MIYSDDGDDDEDDDEDDEMNGWNAALLLSVPRLSARVFSRRGKSSVFFFCWR